MIYIAYVNPNRRKQMANRITRKSPVLPKQNATAVISYVRELPGAMFFSPTPAPSITGIDPESLAYAIRLQNIRASYEHDDCQEMLWHDLSQMGFDSSEIRQFVTNPAAITNCGYGMPNGLR
jgi:hypothetical protein